MSNAKFMNIARLMTTYKLEIDIEMLPDNLKCAKCKLVLKDACQVQCGCRFCRACIEDLIASGSKFCPGVADYCGESLLSDFVTDYVANKSISKLIVKCPQNGCVHQCELVALDDHMRVCGRNYMACPFHELGCQQDKLVAEEINGHFQQENLSHSEILIRMIADINREMESHKREIEMLKHDLVLKEGEIRTMTNQMKHVVNENKSIKDEIKLIKDEKADLAKLVRVLSEKIDKEIDERRESDERDMVNVIEYVDKELTATTEVIGSNKDKLDTAMRSVENDVRSFNQDSIKPIKDDMNFIKSQVESVQKLALLGQIDASCEWTIDGDVRWTIWSGGDRTSEYFTGAVYPYKYRLSSGNNGGELYIYLLIYPEPSDSRLSWPFSGKVVITVADMSECNACKNITLDLEIKRPPDYHFSSSNPFIFVHYALVQAGLDLTRGIRVSCVIIPSRVLR